jgi:hypothetical protein
VAGRLRDELGLGEPFADPGIKHFGLRNAVFCLGDSFLEVVSPVQPDTAAGRLLERRGGDCGYMLMFQVDELPEARERVREQGVREVFEVSLPDMSEVHLHPADMRGAIVALSQPEPPEAWRWGGPEWERRSAAGRLAGATVAVDQPVSLVARWQAVLDVELEPVGVRVSTDDLDRGLTEIVVQVPGRTGSVDIGGVCFVFDEQEDEE